MGFFGIISSALAKRPAVSFFGLIILLFGLISAGNFLRTPPAVKNNLLQEKKETAIFTPSTDTAFLSVPAEVKKENIISIAALAPGIITAIHTAPGHFASAGQTLVELTNDFQSGSASLLRQIAENNDTLTRKLAGIDKRIFELRQKQTKNDATLTSTAEKIELKQLEEDRAQSKIDLQNSDLNRKLAEVNDAVLKPKTFVSGTVESLRIKRGDFVSAGETLFTLRTSAGAATIEALISRKTAALFDPTKATLLTVDGETIDLLPTYFSRSETSSGLFSILFTLSDTIKNRVSNGEFLTIEIPLRTSGTSTELVPIDAISEDNSGASVLVEENGIAAAKTVVLGNIYGSFAEITSGLLPDEHIVLSRAVIKGDPITPR